MIKEFYTVINKPTKCDTCGDVTDVFQWYEWTDNGPQVWMTECGYCDEYTDPRGGELAEDLQNPEMWSEQMKEWSKTNA